MSTAFTQEDWDRAAGVPCPNCGQETFRFLFVRNTKLCPACFRAAQERIGQEMEMKALVSSLRKLRHRKWAI